MSEDMIQELVEFKVGDNRYGLPIGMVNEIIQPQPVTKIPQSHPYVEGIIQLRGEVFPVLDFLSLFGGTVEGGQEKFIVAQVEGKNVVFHVGDVLQIHRIPLHLIEEPTDLYEGKTLPVTGIVKFEEEQVMILMDYGKLLTTLLKD